MTILFFTTVFVLISFFSDQALYAAHPWPMFRHDLKHTGHTEYTGPAEPNFNWVFQASSDILSSPSVAEDGTVYVGDMGNTLYAVHSDGSLKWTFTSGGGIFSSPAVTEDSIIYFTSFDGKLYAIRDNGNRAELLWDFPTAIWMFSSPAVDPTGIIYFGGLNFNIYALNEFGSEIWHEKTGWCVFSSPAVSDDGTMYIGSKDEHVFAFKNDNLIWKFQTGTFYDGHMVDSSPAIGPDGTIYVGTDPYGATGHVPVPVSTVFFAINPDGTMKWSFDMEDGTESSPAIGPDGTIYVGSYDGHLYAIADEGDKGVLKWKYKTGGVIDASPTVDGIGRIYIGSRDGNMYAFEPDGTLLWTFTVGVGIESSASIDDKGHLYFGTFGGGLYSLGTEGPDVGVVSIGIPDVLTSSETLLPEVNIGIYRNIPTSFDVTMIISSEGHEMYRDTVTPSVSGNERLHTVVFQPWELEGESGAEYLVSVETKLRDDENPINDEKVKTITISDDVLVNEDVVEEFILLPCYPNPFNAETTIRYTIPNNNQIRHEMLVQLNIYDIRGSLIRTLVDDHLLPGSYTSVWNGTNDNEAPVASGIYIYTLEMGERVASQKMLFIR
jgi:outer membrane protein assembly factor BamB